jgi:hypothetical protein
VRRVPTVNGRCHFVELGRRAAPLVVPDSDRVEFEEVDLVLDDRGGSGTASCESSY